MHNVTPIIKTERTLNHTPAAHCYLELNCTPLCSGEERKWEFFTEVKLVSNQIIVLINALSFA